MNKTNIVDFSNVFSPKSQSILAKGHLILSQLSKTQKISPKKSSASKSPTNKKQFIANFPKQQSYRLNSKIVLTHDRIRQIHDRLDIDTTTMRQFEKRMKTDKLYFDGNDNPFTSEFQIKEKSPKIFQAQKTIVSEMARMRQNTYEKLTRKLANMHSPAKEIIVKMQKSRDKKNPKSKERKSKNFQTFAKQIQKRLQLIKDEFEQLDELVQTKEQNFFEKLYHKQPKNIFLLIKDRNHPDFRSNRQILNLLHFNLDSMVSLQKQKFHTNILQQISSYSRLLVKGLKAKKMPQIMVLTSSDLSINIEEPSFDDIMLISSGKLSSSVLMTYIREEGEETHKKKKATEDEDSKQNEKNPIHYRDHTRNAAVDFNPVDQMKAQIQYYGRSQYTNIQKQQNIMSKTLENNLNKVMQQELRVISHTIRDKRVMHQFLQEKNRTLEDLLKTNADNRISLLMKEVQRKIRMYKISKNRAEKIKINTLTEAFRMKKMIEKSKQKKSNSRESRYSPLKTWRG